MTIAYVILHYLSGKDTDECVKSILEATKSSQHATYIVVVDNGSANDSYTELYKTYSCHPQVTLIHSEKNLGFAQGNNLGFVHAKYELKADFIVVLNNDTIISQRDFNEVLVKKYEETGFAVLGPDIVTADGFHQNPGEKQAWTLRQLRMLRFKRRVWNFLNYLHLVSPDNGNTKALDYRKEKLTEDRENTILHGACLIFSQRFISRCDGLNPDTFLYMEEDILKLQADCYGLPMLYSGDLSVFHKEDVATNMINGTTDEKARRKNHYIIQSSLVYSKLLRRNILHRAVGKCVGKIKGTGEYSVDPEMPLSYLWATMLRRGSMLLRGIVRGMGMKKHGKFLFVGKKVTFRCKSKMVLGKGVTIQDGVFLDALSEKGLSLGDSSSIGSGTIIRCSGNMKKVGKGFSMGDRSSLADNCFVGATGGVWIGNDVIGGQNIRFHSSNHNYEDLSLPIRVQGVTARGIRVGNDCWIGAGVVFCDGVTIGDGCVIGANSVVTKSFPDNCVIAGVPARIIRMRG